MTRRCCSPNSPMTHARAHESLPCPPRRKSRGYRRHIGASISRSESIKSNRLLCQQLSKCRFSRAHGPNQHNIIVLSHIFASKQKALTRRLSQANPSQSSIKPERTSLGSDENQQLGPFIICLCLLPEQRPNIRQVSKEWRFSDGFRCLTLEYTTKYNGLTIPDQT